MHLRLYGLGLYRVGAGVVAAGYKYYNCSECCKRLLTLTRVSDATERLPLAPIEDEVDCEATGADRARRNPGRRRVRLTGGASFGEFGRLDMWLCSQFTISGVQISILDTLCISNWSI